MTDITPVSATQAYNCSPQEIAKKIKESGLCTNENALEFVGLATEAYGDGYQSAVIEVLNEEYGYNIQSDEQVSLTETADDSVIDTNKQLLQGNPQAIKSDSVAENFKNTFYKKIDKSLYDDLLKGLKGIEYIVNNGSVDGVKITSAGTVYTFKYDASNNKFTLLSSENKKQTKYTQEALSMLGFNVSQIPDDISSDGYGLFEFSVNKRDENNPNDDVILLTSDENSAQFDINGGLLSTTVDDVVSFTPLGMQVLNPDEYSQFGSEIPDEAQIYLHESEAGDVTLTVVPDQGDTYSLAQQGDGSVEKLELDALDSLLKTGKINQDTYDSIKTALGADVAIEDFSFELEDGVIVATDGEKTYYLIQDINKRDEYQKEINKNGTKGDKVIVLNPKVEQYYNELEEFSTMSNSKFFDNIVQEILGDKELTSLEKVQLLSKYSDRNTFYLNFGMCGNNIPLVDSCFATLLNDFVMSNASASDTKKFIETYIETVNMGDLRTHYTEDLDISTLFKGLSRDVVIDNKIFVGKRTDGTQYNLTSISQLTSVFGIQLGNAKCAIHNILNALNDGKITIKEAYIAVAMCYTGDDGILDSQKLADDYNSMSKFWLNRQQSNIQSMFEILSYPLENE